ncbi:hypothetical protein PENSPDRAFT_591568, partial [Peniophora sp. CONT]
NPYHPFRTKLDWDLASWAKTNGIGANAFTALLKIEGVRDRLGLQFRNNRELNKIMDKSLPSRPTFTRRSYTLGGEKHDMYMRNSLDVLKALFGRPDLAKDLMFAPEKHYLVKRRGRRKKKTRTYHEMNTAEWWWETQVRLETKKAGATIIPLIISSDKTLLTQFRNRSAYPVYLTIGNIPKDLRRKTSLQAQVLLGYLPVTKLDGIKNEEQRRRALINLFHVCIRDILKPLRDVATDGVIMASGDGVRRRCHPLLAAYVADYPEQVLVTGVKNSHCPKGTLNKNRFGTEDPCPLRDVDATVKALNRRSTHPNDYEGYIAACAAVDVKPIKAFWTDYPYADIYQALTPDILHQLYQGMVKHLIVWLKHVYGAKAIDARFKCLPANHQLRQFNKGISSLSRVTGKEHQDICRVLLGIIVEMKPRHEGSHARVLVATRALLDFIYLAQYPEASEDTLAEMDAALKRFHQYKGVFVDMNARAHMNFPKLHSLAHYVRSIRMFGTPDNFNTAYSERLHIDYTKSAWRATNRKDEYPQMTLWLQRREQLLTHRIYIDWCLQGRPAVHDMPRAAFPGELKLKKTIARHANVKSLSFDKAESLYGAEDFEDKLKEFVVHLQDPDLTAREVEERAEDKILGVHSVRAFHRLKFWHADALERDGDLVQELPDSIIARPAYKDTQRREQQGRFNTALVDEFGDGKLRIAQVRLIFGFSKTQRQKVFGEDEADYPKHFAYVEWFSRTPSNPGRYHGLKYVERTLIDDERVVSILPLDRIKRSVSLIPRFGPRINRTWTADNVLEKCAEFYINSFSDKHAYITIR